MKKKMDKKNLFIKILTGCNGCYHSILFNKEFILNHLKNYNIINDEISFQKPSTIDLVIIIGSVNSKKEKKDLDEIYEKFSKILLLGTCANFGNIHQKNQEFFDNNDKRKNAYKIHGCPFNKDKLNDFFIKFENNIAYKEYRNPVCHECQMDEQECLLKNSICSGVITNGSCGGLCPKANTPCIGCNGPIPRPNLDAYKHLVKRYTKNINEEVKRLKKFASSSYEKKDKR